MNHKNKIINNDIWKTLVDLMRINIKVFLRD